MVLSKSAVTPQTLSLPSGEASISGMGESFKPLLTTGAASMSIPIALPPGRAGVQPSPYMRRDDPAAL
jgi:hypothetical protein